MGYRVSPPFCQLVVRKYDLTGTGRIGLDNFIQVGTHTHTHTHTHAHTQVHNCSRVHTYR